jgi:RHS repeat-associated protein
MGSNEAYQFDTLGNRSTWSTDPLDSRRLLNDGTYQYRYDDEGNLSAKTELATGKITTYQWDYRNRLVSVTSDSHVIEYLYDAQDKRVGKQLDGIKIERYIYDGDDIALVVNAQGTLIERYLYGDSTDSVLAVERDGTMSWSLADRQGSVVDLVDEDGTVLNHFVYDSFGNRTQTSEVEFRYGYTGRELDRETGLYYYRARYYDASVGRFISEDPMGFGAGDTNLYRYVFNNATNYTDPSGQIVPLIAAGMVAMGVMNALIDVNVQLAVNNMTDKTDMNWASVGVSFATGMLGFGLAQKATQVSSLAWKIAGNPLAQRAVDSGIDGVGKVVENGINGKAWNNELAETVAGNFVLGGAADISKKVAPVFVEKLLDKLPASAGTRAIKDIVDLTPNISWDVDTKWNRGQAKAFVKSILNDESAVAVLKKMDNTVAQELESNTLNFTKRNRSINIKIRDEINSTTYGFDADDILNGLTDRNSNGNIMVLLSRKNVTTQEMIDVIKHESLHVTYKGSLPGTKYEEYLARVRQSMDIYQGKWVRPDLLTRRGIWEKVLTDYHALPIGKTPSTFMRSLDD